jgi:hypothetical protein
MLVFWRDLLRIGVVFVSLFAAACTGGSGLPAVTTGDADATVTGDTADGVAPDLQKPDLAGDVTPDLGPDIAGPDVLGPDVEPDVPGEVVVFICKEDADCLALRDQVGIAPCVNVRCDVASGTCVAEKLPDGVACDPGDACVELAFCKAGECHGTPVVCDDGNLCTDDTCDTATGCAYANNEAACDDGNPCTQADACKEGACVGGENVCPCGTAEDCWGMEDGNQCNGTLDCVDGTCVVKEGSVVVCEQVDDTGCILNACNPATGQCGEVAAAEGASCDDHSLCTKGDVCIASLCVGAEAAVCDDGTPCTADECDPEVGCTFAPVDGTCDDGNECSKDDKCLDGVCTGTLGAECSCTKDEECAAFDDGDACNGLVLCKNKLCVTDPATVVVCDSTDDTACKKNECKSDTGECVMTAQEDGTSCDDDDICTIKSACEEGECVGTGEGMGCDDGNPCTVDSCSPGKGCTHTPIDGACDDADACTADDACTDGACKGAPVGCDDGNPCTDDACYPQTGCSNNNNTMACDDGDVCTLDDACFNGECVANGTLDCDDENLCTDDVCDPWNGCSNPANTAPCDDQDACTVGDVCADGACVSGEAANCNDVNPCTDDSCDALAGCQYANNSEPCDDGDKCSNGDACVDGQCFSGKPLECDDSNPCTDDSCDPATGCVNLDNVAQCDDANFCTTQDVCDTGACKGGPAPECDDGNPCTDDSCDPAVGCVHKDNSLLCDDGNACSQNDVCMGGKCIGTGVPDCDDKNPCTTDTCDPITGCVQIPNTVACDDGNLCTTADACAAGKCVGGPAPKCDDGNKCTDDSCAPAIGCVNVNNTAPCDDGNKCTEGDACGNGACQAGTPVSCDDANVCTSEVCVPAAGCVVIPNMNPCSDGNPCTVGDICQNNVCVPGTAQLACDDFNPCTADSCDPKVGCVHAPTSEGKTCDDGNKCTENDKCAAGVCAGTGTNCDDGNPCTDDKCEDAETGCFFEPNANPCDDGNVCTTADTCAAGICSGVGVLDCSDGNPCTDDLCDPVKGCNYKNNVLPCDDGSFCTTADTCAGGQCAGGPAPDCNDGNACTKDACDPEKGCVYSAFEGACEDGSKCTVGDKCVDSSCAGGPALDCDDGNPCTDDSCVANLGCVHVYNTSPCDDGNACTTADTCGGGKCVGGPALSCNDGNPCTTDSCDPKLGCLNANNTLPCDDGNACTTADTCGGGKCVSGPALVCDDKNLCTTDTCKPATGCVYSPNTLPCDDLNACTTADTCSAGKCVGGAPLKCDDGNFCTDDSCDTKSGCVFTNNTKPCDDGSKCTANDVCTAGKCVGQDVNCDDKNVCTSETCIPAVGCVYINNANACEDGSKCTSGDKCADGKCVPGATVNCDDGNACTADSCAPATGCVYKPVVDGTKCDDGNECTTGDKCTAGKCGGTGLNCDDGNPCTDDKCALGIGCYYQNNTAACDDGNKCTTVDKCANKVCVGSVPPNCDDGNPCTDDSCDPTKGCLNVNNTLACDDGNKCTTADKCAAGKCVGGPAPNCDDSNPCTNDSCDPTLGCVNTNNTLACEDGSKCTVGDKCSGGKCVPGPAPNCDDSNVCTDDSCDPATGCVNKNNTLACDDGSKCTAGDKCSAGKCVPGPALDCDDKNVCTSDKCEPASGCVYSNNTLPCNDSNVCTDGDVCSGGKCVPGGPLNCDDGNVCTDDACDAGKGCYYKDNTGPCDDGNLCTLDDACSAGECTPGPAVTCDDYNPCTNDSCDPVTGKCWYVLGGACALKTVPFYDTVDCASTLWAFTPATGGVGWAVDGTPAAPGKLTGSCSVNYNNGTNYAGTTSGNALTAFLFDASAVTGSMTLTFHSYNGVDPTEGSDSYDVMLVQASTDGFNTVAFEKQLLNSLDRGKWIIQAFDLSALKGKKFQVRFRFDSKDPSFNNGPGWFVEDVNVYAGPIVTVTGTAPYKESFPAANTNGWQMSAAIGGVGWAIDATAADPGKFEGDASLNFNDGVDYLSSPPQQVYGSALSPVIDLTGVTVGTPVSILYRSWSETEGSSLFDLRNVEASTLAFTSNQASYALGVAGEKGWKYEWLNLTPLAGTKFRLRFRFDSLDGSANNYKGWFVDAAEVAALPVPVYGDGVVCSQNVWSFSNPTAPVSWAVDATPNPPAYSSADCSLNFNNGANYSCSGGTWHTYGTATSANFTAAAPQTGKKLYLNFMANPSVETGSNFDKLTVRVIDNANPANKVEQAVSPKDSKWSAHSIDISTLHGKSVRIEFLFDSVDCVNNSTPGVFIDDVLVRAQ